MEGKELEEKKKKEVVEILSSKIVLKLQFQAIRKNSKRNQLWKTKWSLKASTTIFKVTFITR